MKKTRVDTGVTKGQVALFWKDRMITGKCTWTGKKYKDGEVIIEITLIKQIHV